MVSARFNGSICSPAVGLVAITVAMALASCSRSQNFSPVVSAARIEQVRFSPGQGSTVYPGTELAIDMEYQIETGEGAPPGDYFAVVEVSSLDHRRLYLEACGGHPRRSLTAPGGRVRLQCRMRLDPAGHTQGVMSLQVRIYQRTDPDRRVMLASSEAASFRLRSHAIETWQRVFMDRCPAPGKDDGTVLVCRT